MILKDKIMSNDHYYRNDEELNGERAEHQLVHDRGIEAVATEPIDQRHAQPYPSPLSSPEKKKQPTEPTTSGMTARRSNSSSSEEESTGTRSVMVSVLRDTGSKVEIMLKAHGLKKKKSLLNSLVTVFKKPHHPSRLLANGKFTEFVLNENSLRFLLEVKTDKKKKKGNENRIDTFLCEVKKFPTAINPDSAEFEVLEPASGEAFILLTLIKVGNLSINWKDFLDQNGTIDVASI